jgi:hypothetical protein
MTRQVISVGVDVQRQLVNILKFLVSCNAHINFTQTPDISDFLSVPDKNVSLPGFGQTQTFFAGTSGKLANTVVPENVVVAQ